MEHTSLVPGISSRSLEEMCFKRPAAAYFVRYSLQTLMSKP